MKVLMKLSFALSLRGVEQRRRLTDYNEARRGLEVKDGSKWWPTTVVDAPARNGSKVTLIIVVSGRSNAHPSGSALQALELGVVRQASERKFKFVSALQRPAAGMLSKLGSVQQCDTGKQ